MGGPIDKHKYEDVGRGPSQFQLVPAIGIRYITELARWNLVLVSTIRGDPNRVSRKGNCQSAELHPVPSARGDSHDFSFSSHEGASVLIIRAKFAVERVVMLHRCGMLK